MKKVGVLLILILLISSLSFVSAAIGDDCTTDDDCDSEEVCVDDECVECEYNSDCEDDEECSDGECVIEEEEEDEEEEEIEGEGIEQAYNCLENKVEGADDCEDLSLEEQIFSLLALGYNSGLQSACKTEIVDNGEDDCWPEDNCKIKQTAQVLLAFDNIGKNTDDIEDWLKGKEKTADLIWYLEVDSDLETECEINGHDFKIRDDKKLTKNAGSCLTLTQEDYWFKISSNCLDDEFEITCDEDFKATLLYKKQGGEKIYVSNEVESGSADAKIELSVNSFCFGTSGCDYEGSLWAAYALAIKNGKSSISEYLPYLMAYEEDNKKYFPSTFLYAITGFEDYYNKIIQEQKTQGFWGEGGGKYYETALALLALDSNAEAEEYLLDVQGDDGCWPSIRDTAFLLFAGWPKSPVITGSDIVDCPNQYFCVSPGDCESENRLDKYDCAGSKVCCKEQPELKSCYELNGKLCDYDEDCEGTVLNSLDSKTCCDGECVDEPTPSQCENAGYECYIGIECPEGYESVSSSCDTGEICCKKKGGSWWIWILILLILIALVVLGYFYRNKLRVWLFKLKDKFDEFRKKKGGKGTGPGKGPPKGPPSIGPRRMMPRKILPPRSIQPRPLRKPMPKKSSGFDKELDDTLKKLKDMSK